MGTKIISITPYGVVERFVQPGQNRIYKWCGIGITEGVIVHTAWGASLEQCRFDLISKCPNLEHQFYPVGDPVSLGCREQAKYERPR